MKGMKKLLCVLLAGAMIMGLCACGKTGSGKSGKDDDDDDRGRRSERTEDEDEDEDDDDDDDRHGRNRRSDDEDETKGRKYYEQGGDDGEYSYYLIDDKSPEEIVELYAYYRDAADEIGLDYQMKFRDYLLVEPDEFDVGDADCIDIDYKMIFDDPYDYVKSIRVKEDLFKHVECSMEVVVFDQDRAEAILKAFVDRYAVDGAEVKDYDGDGYYTNGYMINIGYEQTYFVSYKTKGSDPTYYEVRFSESKSL